MTVAFDGLFGVKVLDVTRAPITVRRTRARASTRPPWDPRTLLERLREELAHALDYVASRLRP